LYGIQSIQAKVLCEPKMISNLFLLFIFGSYSIKSGD